MLPKRTHRRSSKLRYALHKNRLTRFDYGMDSQGVRREMKTKGSYLRHALAEEYHHGRKSLGSKKHRTHLKKQMGA